MCKKVMNIDVKLKQHQCQLISHLCLLIQFFNFTVYIHGFVTLVYPNIKLNDSLKHFFESLFFAIFTSHQELSNISVNNKLSDNKTA